MKDVVVRTDEAGWAKRVAKQFKNRQAFRLVDDASLGVDPTQQSLYGMMASANLGRSEWTGVLVMLGVSALGARILTAALGSAVAPPVAVAFTLVGGAMTLWGAGSAYKTLTGIAPGAVKVSPSSFDISF